RGRQLDGQLVRHGRRRVGRAGLRRGKAEDDCRDGAQHRHRAETHTFHVLPLSPRTARAHAAARAACLPTVGNTMRVCPSPKDAVAATKSAARLQDACRQRPLSRAVCYFTPQPVRSSSSAFRASNGPLTFVTAYSYSFRASSVESLADAWSP